MTVSSSYTPVREVGNGVTQAFDFSFKIYNASELDVYKIVRSTGVLTLQTLNTDYTVSINTITEGGTVTYTVAPTALQDSFITRGMARTQDADIPTNNLFRETQIENALDKQLMIIQELEESLDRCVKFGISSTSSNIDFPEPEAEKVIGWNTAGTALENKTPMDEDSVVAAQAAQTAAETAAASIVNGNLQVIIDGGGLALTTGKKVQVTIPFACTLTGYTMVADQAGAIVIDVNRSTYSGFPTTATICGSGKECTIAATNQKATDVDIANWTSTAIAAGDILEFEIDSCTNIIRILLSLNFTRT